MSSVRNFVVAAGAAAVALALVSVQGCDARSAGARAVEVAGDSHPPPVLVPGDACETGVVVTRSTVRGWTDENPAPSTWPFEPDAHVLWSQGDDVWMQLDGRLLHREPRGWTSYCIRGLADVGPVVGIDGASGSDLWLVSYPLALSHWDGRSWSLVRDASSLGQAGAMAVRGSDVWIAWIDPSTIQEKTYVGRWDGTQLTSELVDEGHSSGSGEGLEWTSTLVPEAMWFDSTGSLELGGVKTEEEDISSGHSAIVASRTTTGWTLNPLNAVGPTPAGPSGRSLAFPCAGSEVIWTGTRWTSAYGSESAWAITDQDLWQVGSNGIAHGSANAWDPPLVTGVFEGLVVGSTDAWAFGFDGSARHFDGQAWSTVVAPRPNLVSAWATASSLWVGDNTGAVLRKHDGQWSREQLSTTHVLSGLWGTSDDDLWAISGPQLFHRDALGWHEVLTPLTSSGLLIRILGSAPDDVWAEAYGDSGQLELLHSSGSAWSTVSMPTAKPGAVDIGPDGQLWVVECDPSSSVFAYSTINGTWTAHSRPPSSTVEACVLDVAATSDGLWGYSSGGLWHLTSTGITQDPSVPDVNLRSFRGVLYGQDAHDGRILRRDSSGWSAVAPEGPVGHDFAVGAGKIWSVGDHGSVFSAPLP